MQNASLNTLCRTRRFLQPCKIRRKNKARDTHYILVLRDRIPTDSLMHPLIGDSRQELGDAVGVEDTARTGWRFNGDALCLQLLTELPDLRLK
jgi:hypothetical protein